MLNLTKWGKVIKHQKASYGIIFRTEKFSDTQINSSEKRKDLSLYILLGTPSCTAKDWLARLVDILTTDAIKGTKIKFISLSICTPNLDHRLKLVFLSQLKTVGIEVGIRSAGTKLKEHGRICGRNRTERNLGRITEKLIMIWDWT